MLEEETFTTIFLREIYMTSCLLEASPTRKTKITLSDYNYQKDIQNRLLMAQFSHNDLTVLEAILYSSLQIPIVNLAKDLEMPPEDLMNILHKIEKTGLFILEKQKIIVDKEARKYFESQIQKFEEDFVPNMDFLQTLLKKVPIHVLPTWYAISRTSNNIFDSLIEKHLFTPQIYQRYLTDIGFDPILKQIIEEVHASKTFEVSVEDLLQKLSVSRETFEEYMLYLEFHFVCCVKYQKTQDGWKELVTLFHEWRKYLQFLQETEAPTIQDSENIKTCYHQETASRMSDLITLLTFAKKQPLFLQKNKNGLFTVDPSIAAKMSYQPSDSKESYIDSLIAQLTTMNFIDLSQNKMQIEEIAEKWLTLSEEEKSLYLYRNPKNRTFSDPSLEEIFSDKSIREVEKSLVRILNKGWVFFDDFIKGTHVALQDHQTVKLQKTGKNWNYTLPTYSSKEKDFFHAILFNWLADSGSLQTGSLNGKDCLRITTLGQKLFAR